MTEERSRTAADTAGVIAPPPLIYAGFLLAGLGLDRLWPTDPGLGAAGDWAGSALVLAGLAAVIACALRFRAAGTAIEPYRPTSAIVTSGLYRLSRNPIYVALTAVYLGLALIDDNAWILILALPVLALMTWGVIAREERYLEGKFGEEYRSYKARVRRWL
jgi:protein-S-isoprenylcysteine O-methyltransferase Ste14